MDQEVAGEHQVPFPIWKTVVLGRHQHADAYSAALLAHTKEFMAGALSEYHSNYHRIFDRIKQILLKMPIAKAETSVDLVRLTVQDMISLDDKGMVPKICAWENSTAIYGVTSAQIYSWVEKHGLELCPAEVGPALCLQSNQQQESLIAIGMEAIADSDGDLLIFYLVPVKRNNNFIGLHLDANYGMPSRNWHLDSALVFVRPNKK